VRLRLRDYKRPDFDPDAPFVPHALLGDETLENAILDPAIFATRVGLPPDALRQQTTRLMLRDVLRQQQFLVFDVGRSVGVLSEHVPAVSRALQFVDLASASMDAVNLAESMLGTAIGLAAKTLGSIPNLYVQIAAAALALVDNLVRWAQWIGKIDQPQARLVIPEMPMQEYSSQTDADLFNSDVRVTMQTGYDWSRIFSPRYAGKLTGITAKNRIGQRSIGWALGTGQVPRVVYPASGRHADRHKWRYVDARTEGGGFLASGGLGMMPGGDRIFGIVQTTATEAASGPRRGHPTVYDPRCDAAISSDPVVRTDLGSYYPVTTQGAASLWSFVTRRGPEMFTIDCFGLMNGRTADKSGAEMMAWPRYLTRIWEGVVQLWRAEKYEGGWGCSFWKAALQQLVQAYTVSGDLGVGVVSWTPTSNKALTSKDQDKWEAANVYDARIKDTLQKLAAEQLLALGTSNVAAYLPIKGGADADPLRQPQIMGAMREYQVRRAFVQARKRILNTDAKKTVCLRDVLDPEFKRQITRRGGGTKDCDALEPSRTTPGDGGAAAVAAAVAGALWLLL
jgi:hypothetical protein